MRIQGKSDNSRIPRMSEIEGLASEVDSSSDKVEQKLGVLESLADSWSISSDADHTVPDWAIQHAKIHYQFKNAVEKMQAAKPETLSENVVHSLDRSHKLLTSIIDKVGAGSLIQALQASEHEGQSELDVTSLPPIDEHLASIDDQLLAFIHGDSFIGSTRYEGGNTIENIVFLLDYLQEKEEKFSKSSVLPLLEDLVARHKQYPLHSAPTPSGMAGFQEEAIDYANSLCQNALSLKPGERFLIRGGWKEPGGGHSMLYLVEKSAESSYTFTVINTGAGLEHHDSAVSGYKTKYKPILRLQNIDADHMCNPRFYSSLLELDLPTDKRGISWGHNADEIYKRILPALKGTRDVEYENQVDFITDQRSGSCSWKSFIKLLQLESKDRDSYKKFNFDLRRDSLNAYFQKGPHSDEQIKLIKRSAESFACMALKLYKANIIDQKALTEAQHLCHVVSNSIQEREIQLSEQTARFLAYDELQPCQLSLAADIAITHTPKTYGPHQFGALEASTAWQTQEVPDTLPKLNALLSQVNELCKKCYAVEKIDRCRKGKGIDKELA